MKPSKKANDNRYTIKNVFLKIYPHIIAFSIVFILFNDNFGFKPYYVPSSLDGAVHTSVLFLVFLNYLFIINNIGYVAALLRSKGNNKKLQQLNKYYSYSNLASTALLFLLYFSIIPYTSHM